MMKSRSFSLAAVAAVAAMIMTSRGVSGQPFPTSCVGLCGVFIDINSCNCDDDCLFYSDCCDDFLDVCLGGGVPPPFPPFPPDSDPLSCAGDCGRFFSATCNCDELCTVYLDCCDDFTELCLPPSPPLSSSVVSDPHLFGLRGQSFDFTGEPGHIYALLSDDDLRLNALFSSAFTTGLSLDSDRMTVQAFTQSGTWITAIGLQVGADRLRVSVEDSIDSECQGAEARGGRGECLLGGSVALNGAPLRKVGTYESGSMALTLKNSKSFARIVAEADTIEITLDYVPPVKAWHTPPADRAAYSHINIKIAHLSVSGTAHGVLGSTQTLKYDAVTKQPIMKSAGKNGEGILDGTPEDYEVSDLFAADFTFAPKQQESRRK